VVCGQLRFLEIVRLGGNFSRFLLVGGLGFFIDAGGTSLLILLGVAAWAARVPAIILAIVFTWLANRNFTYQIDRPKSVNEAARYAIAAALMAALNYIVFLVLITNQIWPLAAITVSTGIQAAISFHFYRIFVFKMAK